MTATPLTVGFTESDRAANYVPYDDGYRPGAEQQTVRLLLTDPDGPAPSLDDWAEALFTASNSPGAAPHEHPAVAAARRALVDARLAGIWMRSLSVGDTVTIGDRSVACDKGVGWKPVALATPTPVQQAATLYAQIRDDAMAAYRAVVSAPGDRQLQADYDAALAALARFYPSYRQAHAAVGAYVAEADRFTLHVHLEHGGVAAACSCPV